MLVHPLLGHIRYVAQVGGVVVSELPHGQGDRAERMMDNAYSGTGHLSNYVRNTVAQHALP